MWGGIKAGMDQIRQDEKDQKIADLQTRADERAQETFKLSQLKFKMETIKDLNLYNPTGSKSDKTNKTVKDVLKLKNRLREGFDTYSEEDQKRITNYENKIVQDPLEAAGVLKALTELGKKGRKFSPLELIDTFEIINFVEGTNTEKRAELAETLNVDLSMDEFVKMAELAATYTPPSVTVDYNRADVTPMTTDQMTNQAVMFKKWLGREANRVINSKDTSQEIKKDIVTLQGNLNSNNEIVRQSAMDALTSLLFPDTSVFEVVKNETWGKDIDKNMYILAPYTPVVKDTGTPPVTAAAISFLNNNPNNLPIEELKAQFEKKYKVSAEDYITNNTTEKNTPSGYSDMNQEDFLNESR